MRILLACDKFKGSLTAVQVHDSLAAGLRDVRPDVDIVALPVADGGDGTLDAAVHAGFTRLPTQAEGPTGLRVPTAFALRGDTAVIELATICGLDLLGAARAPLTATSRGVGTVLAAALDAGARHLVLGIGGSASTDAGVGMLDALGARFIDTAGRPVGPGGGALGAVRSIDLSGLHPRLPDVELVVAGDVDNPLSGPNGAAAVYGPQKGASPDDVRLLDHHLAHVARLFAEQLGVDHAVTAGAGAAGGVGFGALVLGATIRSGIELVLDLVDITHALRGIDLVVTGEGSIDEQTLAGKAPVGVARAARSAGVPVIAVAGRCTVTRDALERVGIDRVITLQSYEPDERRSITHAAELLRRVGAVINGSADRYPKGSG